MSSVHTLRMILTAGAAITAVVALFFGELMVAGVMTVAVTAHLGMSAYLRKTGALTRGGMLFKPDIH